MIIKDMRDKRILDIFKIDDNYHPGLYHTHGISNTSREITTNDIESCKIKAISENAECLLILNYGIQWYIPN